MHQRSPRPRQCRVLLFAAALAVAAPRAEAQTSVFPVPEWAVSTPAAEGMDPAKFAAAMAQLPSPAIVIRHGKIIGMHGDVTRPGPLFSASKALLSALAGVLMQRGAVTLDTLVPGSDVPAPPKASIRHFLTMTSDFRLTPHSPGDHYAYNNSAAIHYGGYLIYTFYPGRSEVQALRDAYLDKLGIQDGLSMIGSISGWGGGGFVISTRDYARLAYLILRGGNWNGEQLLPPDFVQALYQNQIPPQATPGGPGSGEVDNQQHVTGHMDGNYSLGWWLPHGPHGYAGSRSNTVAATASGAFGTSMHIVPQYDLVIAGVNTSTTMDAGKIPGAMINSFVAAVVSSVPPPVITAVVNGASFRPGISPGSWFSIFGQNLASGARQWRADEIVDGRLPDILDGVRVLVGGKPAAVAYISPGQINAQAPDSSVIGSITVQVVRDGIISNPFTAGQQPVAPGLFRYLPSAHIAARHTDFKVLAPPDMMASAAPAATNEIVLLYGTGFGATRPAAPAGRPTAESCSLAAPCFVTEPVRVRFGSIWMDATAALSLAGLYQVNVKVPPGVSGEVPVEVEVGGKATGAGTVLRVGN